MEEFQSLFNGVGVLDGNQNVFFQSPSDTPPLSNGDQFFSITLKGMGEKEKEEKRWKKGNKTKGGIFGNPKKREKRKSKKKKEGKWGGWEQKKK